MASTVSACSTVERHWHVDTRSGTREDGTYSRNITRCWTPDSLVQKAYKNVTEDNDRRRPLKARKQSKQPKQPADPQSLVVDNPDFDKYSRLAGQTLAKLNKDAETAESETADVSDTHNSEEA